MCITFQQHEIIAAGLLPAPVVRAVRTGKKTAKTS